MWPTSDLTAAVVSARFVVNDGLSILSCYSILIAHVLFAVLTWANSDVDAVRDNNLAMALVFGTEPEALVAANTAGPRAWMKIPTRVWYGGTPRDFTVI
jgi:hypothetical protein